MLSPLEGALFVCGIALGVVLYMLIKLVVEFSGHAKKERADMAKDAARAIRLTTTFLSLKQGMSLTDVQKVLGDCDDIKIFVRENGEIRKEAIWTWGEYSTHRITVEFINDQLRTMSKL